MHETIHETTHENEHQNGKCHICGSLSYTWGRLIGEDDQMFLPGKPHQPGLLETLAGVQPDNYVKARKCNRCHNIQLFTADPKPGSIL